MTTLEIGRRGPGTEARRRRDGEVGGAVAGPGFGPRRRQSGRFGSSRVATWATSRRAAARAGRHVAGAECRDEAAVRMLAQRLEQRQRPIEAEHVDRAQPHPQPLQHAERHRRAADPAQPAVEHRVGLQVGGVLAAAVALQAAVVDALELVDLRGRGDRHGALGGTGLEVAAHLDQLAEAGPVHGRHHRRAAVVERQRLLGDQPQQRLPHRGRAQAQLGRERTQDQPVAGPQRAADQRAADLGVGPLAQAVATALVEHGAREVQQPGSVGGRQGGSTHRSTPPDRPRRSIAGERARRARTECGRCHADRSQPGRPGPTGSRPLADGPAGGAAATPLPFRRTGRTMGDGAGRG